MNYSLLLHELSIYLLLASEVLLFVVFILLFIYLFSKNKIDRELQNVLGIIKKR